MGEYPKSTGQLEVFSQGEALPSLSAMEFSGCSRYTASSTWENKTVNYSVNSMSLQSGSQAKEERISELVESLMTASIPIDFSACAPFLRIFLFALVDAATTGRRLTRDEHDHCRRLGQETARSGVPQSQVINLFIRAGTVVWPELPSLVRLEQRRPQCNSGVVEVGTAVLRLIDGAITAVHDGYAEAQRYCAGLEKISRRKFESDLLDPLANVNALLQNAELFGLLLAAPHTVAVISGNQPLERPKRIIAVIEATVRSRFRCQNLMVFPRNGSLLVVFTMIRNQSRAQLLGDALSGVMNDVLRTESGNGGWRIAIGRPHAGARGVLRSYRDATDALHLAGRLKLDDAVIDAERLLVYRVLLRDESAMYELIDSVLAPLRDAHHGPEPLLETLDAYFSSGMVVAEAARQLHLSVRAVSYRIARVRALTGYDVNIPSDRIALQIAVTGAGLLGWTQRPRYVKDGADLALQ